MGRLLIAGRVPKQGSTVWGAWRRSATVQLEALHMQVIPSSANLVLRVNCLYGFDPAEYAGDGSMSDWADRLQIPHIAHITEAVFLALLGLLFERRAQVARLEVERDVLPSNQLVAEYGQRWAKGGLILEYEIV